MDESFSSLMARIAAIHELFILFNLKIKTTMKLLVIYIYIYIEKFAEFPCIQKLQSLYSCY